MLKTHAFDSASLFQQSRVEDSDRLKLSAVQDYWRKWFYPLSSAQLEALKALADTPDALLISLKRLWANQEQAPHAAAAVTETPDLVIRNWEIWQQTRDALEATARSAWTLDIVTLVSDAATRKIIKDYRANWLPGWLEQMAQWVRGGTIKVETLQRFSVSRLLEKGWSQASDHPVFAHIEDLSMHLSQEPAVSEQLLAHAATEIGAAYRQTKARLAQFDFSDLLQNLYHALQAADGRLAAAIRQQFPVALVDEFQDTDPWQYGALSKIYANSPDLPGATPNTGLILIGDPKQAIYSFRGADLNTYLAARQQAQAIHTLSGNFRSTPGVVAAVNQVFSHASKPFGEVPFELVEACSRQVQPLQVAGQIQAAMTVWHLQQPKAPNKTQFMRQMAELFATQMVSLLNSQAAKPGDMAVLVKNWTQARAIRYALSQRGVRSVYLSERDSVFATPQATDLWRILRAVANPRATQWIRAALATRLWGKTWVELEALIQNESAWDDLTERFHGWQSIWQRQGLLPMLHHLLHDQSIPTRLLGQGDSQNSQGERELTNVLHLGDVLQTASLGLQGETALLRYLQDQMRQPQASGDRAQLRLESDANLVQVVTMHKAKGLQYPLVFLPFVSDYRAEDKSGGNDDALRLAEDIRLLYVALTRAQRALWLGITPTQGDVTGKSPQIKSAISYLLGRKVEDDLADCLKGWSSKHIVIENAPEPNGTRYTPEAPATQFKPALTPQRNLTSHWWSASFSALTRELENRPTPAATLDSEQDERWGDAQIDGALAANDDETETELFPFNAFNAGSRYGSLLHELLEWQAQKGWPAGQSKPDVKLATEWLAVVHSQATRLNLDEVQQNLLLSWIPAIVATALVLPDTSCALILGATHARQYWVEMAFSLQVKRLNSAHLDQLIGQHIHPGLARQALQPRQLEGMLTGFMDLVLEFEGRFYVLDYKSNKLSAYDPAHLRQAIVAHRYDVQYTLYLLALHRLLKSRLPNYDYDLHIGGALYWFIRGVDQPGAGLYLQQPPKALIDALDTAFAKTPSELT
jgi:exodeoxyribonuclease V beta subunit